MARAHELHASDLPGVLIEEHLAEETSAPNIRGQLARRDQESSFIVCNTVFHLHARSTLLEFVRRMELFNASRCRYRPHLDTTNTRANPETRVSAVWCESRAPGNGPFPRSPASNSEGLGFQVSGFLV